MTDAEIIALSRTPEFQARIHGIMRTLEGDGPALPIRKIPIDLIGEIVLNELGASASDHSANRLTWATVHVVQRYSSSWKPPAETVFDPVLPVRP